MKKGLFFLCAVMVLIVVGCYFDAIAQGNPIPVWDTRAMLLVAVSLVFSALGICAAIWLLKMALWLQNRNDDDAQK